jgi:monoamine oxidase
VHRLDERHAESLVLREGHEDVGRPVVGDLLRVADRARELDGVLEVERGGGRIVYGAEVQEIANTSTGVRVRATVRGRTREVSGDYAVCTIPPTVLRKIPSNFSQQTKDAIAYPVGVAAGKIGLQYRRRFWEEDESIFGGITDTNTEIGTIWYPSSDYLTRRGILIGAYNYFDDSAGWDAITPEQRTERALEIGRAIHGDVYVDEFETSFSAQWRRIRYSEGGWIVWPDRSGPAGAIYRRMSLPQGRLYFAGDHMSHVTSWQHGAFESARAVVMQIHSKVLAEAA